MLQPPQPQVLPGPTIAEVQDLFGDLEQLLEMLEYDELSRLPWEALEELQAMTCEIQTAIIIFRQGLQGNLAAENRDYFHRPYLKTPPVG